MQLRLTLRLAQWFNMRILACGLMLGGDWLLIGMATSLGMIAIQIAISKLLSKFSEKRIANIEAIAAEARNQRKQIEQLFNMTDMLQSAQSHEDAGEVLAATASQLLPDLRGALYIFNNSRGSA